MAVEDVAAEILLGVGHLALYMQAVGLILILWIVFQIVTLYFNRKRRKKLYHLSEQLSQLDEKIDRLEKKLDRSLHK